MSNVRAHPLRPVREGGERRRALALELTQESDVESLVAEAEAATASAEAEGAALVYGAVRAAHPGDVLERLGWTSLGPAPLLARPLRLSVAARGWPAPRALRAALAKAPLIVPFGRVGRPGVRELVEPDPRVTRLWDRFSVDVDVAAERSAAWVGERVLRHTDAGYRTIVSEDGDRYVIRAMCTFRVKSDDGERVIGEVSELLHDRSIAGMRAASRLLGLALREMLEAKAEVAFAWSFHHSGSFPLLARHAFVPVRSRTHLGVRAFDPALSDVVAERRHWYMSGLDFEPA